MATASDAVLVCNLFVMIRFSRTRAALAVGVAVLAVAGVAVAIDRVDDPATVGQPADRVDPRLGDVVVDLRRAGRSIVRGRGDVPDRRARPAPTASTARTGSSGMARIARTAQRCTPLRTAT